MPVRPCPRRPPRSPYAMPAVLSLAVLLVLFALAAVAFRNITMWIVGIVATVATTFLTIGGLRYLLASGDPGEVEKAKGSLRSAGMGYMIAILAPVILDILKSLVGAK